jgi:hypothetical protein
MLYADVRAERCGSNEKSVVRYRPKNMTVWSMKPRMRTVRGGLYQDDALVFRSQNQEIDSLEMAYLDRTCPFETYFGLGFAGAGFDMVVVVTMSWGFR